MVTLFIDIGTNRKRADGNIYPFVYSKSDEEPKKENFVNSETDYITCVFEDDITESDSGLASNIISQKQMAWNK